MAESSSPVAIITGAGSGIGLATARLLAREGWSIVMAGRREQVLREALSTLHFADGVAHEAFATDAADRASCAALIDRTMQAYGRIDALVNNAGYAPLTPIGRHTPELVRATFAINAIGPADLILAAWPHMARRKAGRIVNVSSIATVDPFPGFFAYAAAKASVELMAKSIAKEGASVGIRGFAVAPGAVETAMLRSIIPEKSLPASKTLSPETVASVIVDCAVGRRDSDNGRTIHLPSPGSTTA